MYPVFVNQNASSTSQSQSFLELQTECESNAARIFELITQHCIILLKAEPTVKLSKSAKNSDPSSSLNASRSELHLNFKVPKSAVLKIQQKVERFQIYSVYKSVREAAEPSKGAEEANLVDVENDPLPISPLLFLLELCDFFEVL